MPSSIMDAHSTHMSIPHHPPFPGRCLYERKERGTLRPLFGTLLAKLLPEAYLGQSCNTMVSSIKGTSNRQLSLYARPNYTDELLEALDHGTKDSARRSVRLQVLSTTRAESDPKVFGVIAESQEVQSRVDPPSFSSSYRDDSPN